jgi:prevent-host-death family protein
MNATTMSSRELDRHTGEAWKATEKGPVIITTRGRPTHVLLSIEEYKQLTGSPISRGGSE